MNVADKNKPHIIGKKCLICGKKYDFEQVEFTCPSCGERGILDIEYDYDFVKSVIKSKLKNFCEKDIFAFTPLLPINLDFEGISTKVGQTPILKATRLGNYLGHSQLWIKDDGRLPTASFKDRASAVAIARAKELGIRHIVAASTGNAAASLAGLTAPEGILSIILVPKTAPPAKIAQLLTFGAKVFAVDGSYDDAFALSLKLTEKLGYYLRSTAVNPVLSEGKKTGMFEALLQMGEDIPDTVAVSVGDGCIVGGLAKGALEFYKLGLIPKLPRIIGVQAEGSQVIYKAWKSGGNEIDVKKPSTRADSISVAFPRDYLKALKGVRETSGLMTVVSDEEIFEAAKLSGTYAGIFSEPAAAAAMAGAVKLINSGEISKTEKVLAFSTGSGLKDVEGASRAAGKPLVVGTDNSTIDYINEVLREKREF